MCWLCKTEFVEMESLTHGFKTRNGFEVILSGKTACLWVYWVIISRKKYDHCQYKAMVDPQISRTHCHGKSCSLRSTLLQYRPIMCEIIFLHVAVVSPSLVSHHTMKLILYLLSRNYGVITDRK